MGRLSSTTRGQTSLEGLIIALIVVLLAAIGIGYLATFQAPTTALVLVKTSALRELQRLDSFHQVTGVNYTVISSSNALNVSVNVEPNLSVGEEAFLADDLAVLQNKVREKTSYSSVNITWQ